VKNDPYVVILGLSLMRATPRPSRSSREGLRLYPRRPGRESQKGGLYYGQSAAIPYLGWSFP